MILLYAGVLLTPTVVVAVTLILRTKKRELREDRKLEAAWQKVHMFSERSAIDIKEQGKGGNGHGSPS